MGDLVIQTNRQDLSYPENRVGLLSLLERGFETEVSSRDAHASAGIRSEPAVASFIDLFSGAGGLACGFEQAGLSPLFASDNWHVAAETYRENHPRTPFIEADIRDLPESRTGLGIETVNPLVVAGGPPCQGFSSAGSRNPDDPRNTLVGYYADLATRLQPDVIVFENVEGFLTQAKGRYVIDLLRPLVCDGYRVRLEKHNVAHFGVPQFRKRVIAIAARERHPDPLTPITSAKGMPGAELIGHGLPLVEGVAAYLKRFDSATNDPLSTIKPASELDQERIVRIPQGGTMRDLPAELQHDSWSERANRRVQDGTPSERRGGAPSGMRRLRSSEPSKAITSAATREFIHPIEDRFLTQREAALLQTFPANYMFQGSQSDINTLIGNAVPPTFAYAVALSVVSTLTQDRIIGLDGGIDSLVVTNSTGLSPALARTIALVEEEFGFSFSLQGTLF